MREKLIELIRNTDSCINWGVNSCEECQYGNVEDCYSHALADHLIANGVTIQKWIPESDPPKESGMYNVTVEKLYGITYSDVAYFDALLNKWGTNTHHYSCDKVTHWMPIPEPHKDASE